jgi:hypothetical protein
VLVGHGPEASEGPVDFWRAHHLTRGQ